MATINLTLTFPESGDCRPACCGGGEDCTCDSIGTANMTPAGIANNSCSDCNTTIMNSRSISRIGSTCVWESATFSACSKTLFWRFEQSSGTTWYCHLMEGSTAIATWKTTTMGSMSCIAEPFTYDSETDSMCLWSGATITFNN